MEEEIQHFFSDINSLELTINDVELLLQDIQHVGSILYLGDNCGEICFDKLLIKRIKDINLECRIYFGVRGAAVVNDSTLEDAYFVGMDEYATIISNGDDSLGTVLSRTSPQFQEIYRNAEVIIAKGQANYESLSEENQNIYFLLMAKCKIIADYICPGSLVPHFFIYTSDNNGFVGMLLSMCLIRVYLKKKEVQLSHSLSYSKN